MGNAKSAFLTGAPILGGLAIPLVWQRSEAGDLREELADLQARRSAAEVEAGNYRGSNTMGSVADAHATPQRVDAALERIESLVADVNKDGGTPSEIYGVMPELLHLFEVLPSTR